LLQHLQGFPAVAGADDAVIAAEMGAQIAADSIQDLRFVV